MVLSRRRHILTHLQDIKQAQKPTNPPVLYNRVGVCKYIYIHKIPICKIITYQTIFHVVLIQTPEAAYQTILPIVLLQTPETATSFSLSIPTMTYKDNQKATYPCAQLSPGRTCTNTHCLKMYTRRKDNEMYNARSYDILF